MKIAIMLPFVALHACLGAQQQPTAESVFAEARKDLDAGDKASQLRGIRALATIADADASRQLGVVRSLVAVMATDCDDEVLGAVLVALAAGPDREAAVVAVSKRLDELRVALAKAPKPQWPELEFFDRSLIEDPRPLPPLTDPSKKAQREYEAALKKWQQREKAREKKSVEEQKRRKAAAVKAIAAAERQEQAATRLVALATRLQPFAEGCFTDELVRATKCLYETLPRAAAPMMAPLCRTSERRAVALCVEILTEAGRATRTKAVMDEHARRIARMLVDGDEQGALRNFGLGPMLAEVRDGIGAELSTSATAALKELSARMDVPPPTFPVAKSDGEVLLAFLGIEKAWSDWWQVVGPKLP